MNRFLILVGSTLLLLQGCKSTQVKEVSSVPEPVTYVEGEFNQESLYNLMLAEIAGQRRQFPIALDNYLIQAKKTSDPGVAERATRIAQYMRNPAKIQEAARTWREISPANPEPYQIEANILLHQGLYQEALPLVQKALEYDELRTLALIRGQSSNIDRQILTGYIKMLQQHSENNPPRADLELTLALLFKSAGNTPEAILAFDRSLLLNPENPEALVQKAELLREKGRISEALLLIQSAFEHQPDNRQLHLLYTQLLFQAQKPKTATDQAQILIKNNLKDHQLTYYLGLLMLEHEQTESAEKVLQSLFTLKPEDSSPHFYLGHITQSRGEIEQAIEHYVQVKDGSNVLQALSRAIGLLNTPNDKEKVQQILLDARSMQPTQTAKIFTLEAEWLNLHNYGEEAIIVLDDALTQFNDNTTLLYTRAMMIESSDFPQAEKDLQRILELEPDNPTVQNALGYTLLLHTERYEEAYDLINAALSKEPEDPAILDSMGWALYKLGRFHEALPYLEKAHALYTDPEVSSHLIQVYWATDQKDKAKALLSQSRKNNPDNPFLNEAAQVIDANQ